MMKLWRKWYHGNLAQQFVAVTTYAAVWEVFFIWLMKVFRKR